MERVWYLVSDIIGWVSHDVLRGLRDQVVSSSAIASGFRFEHSTISHDRAALSEW